MTDFATKADLRNTTDELRTELRGEIRAVGVLVEHLGSKIDALAEGFGGMREQMTSEMKALEERLSARIALLEEVVRENSRDIRKNSEEIRKHSGDIRKLAGEIADLRARFDRRDDYRELDKRVTALEERMRTR